MRLQLATVILALPFPALSVAQIVSWDFEGDELTWRPRMDTVTVEHDETVTRDEGRATLHTHGPIEGGWNYAISDSHPMQPDQLYRLSAWVKVTSLGPGTPAPFLKCEFVGEEGAGDMGRASTEPYDAADLGGWQLLTGEFRSPEGVVQCWVALEKGGSDPMEIDAHLDDVTIEEIDELSLYAKYALDPIPEALERMRGVHPRIYLTSDRISELREAIKTTHAHLWEEVRAQADSIAGRHAPEYVEKDSYSGDEQLWQRGVGNNMPVLAMAYVLSDDTKYLDAAREWALASCSYPTWGLGRIDGMDLAAGHQLFGLGIVYDWCYDDLGDEARATIRETLVKRTSAMFEAGAGGKAWWRRSYMQNHLWVNVCGMSVAGSALFDEVEGADRWIGLPLEKFARTMEALGPDGASHEGVGYWQYGVEYMMKFLHLSGQLLGEDIVGDGKWWPNTAAYYTYLTVPRNAWTSRSSLVDIADCPRGNWYGPEHLLRGLAWEYGDGHAQWWANQVDEANIEAASARWLNLVWYDPSVEPKPPTDLPTLRHFDDMDIVSARSDWSGDESLVVFKCGPYIGHEAMEAFTYDPGGGHVHPDAGHFVVFGEGEWLIRDDGYRAKWTGQHNTLLVDGLGQLGEGQKWFSGGACLAEDSRPSITRAESAPELDHIVGDVTDAYPEELGLKRFVRHLLYVKPNVLVVLDDIECDTERDLELRFHPEAAGQRSVDGGYVVTGERSELRITAPFMGDATLSAEDVGGEDRGDKDFTMFTVRLRKRASSWRNATVLSWSAKGEAPPTVTSTQTGANWAFATETTTLVFSWETEQATPIP